MTGINRRVCAILLALTFLFNCVPEALAAEATATSVQLTKTEGTVAVTNSGGRAISLIEKMRVYSGYHLTTEKASYAWLTLDKTKLCKLDAVSELEVRKSGKKLELLLGEGNLFFDVTEPLDDDESLNIRTSTMTVGIRGTCGWVKSVDQWTSRVYVLEGAVQTAVSDPVTGETKVDTIPAGESAVCKVNQQDQEGGKCEIIRDTYPAAEIDGFVLTEAVPDEGLCDKIYEASGLDLRDYPEDPAERLRQDQASVGEKLAVIEEQVQQQETTIAAEPLWADPVPEPAPVQPPPEPPAPTVPPVAQESAESGENSGTSTSTSVGGGGSQSSTPAPPDPPVPPDPPDPPKPSPTVTLTMPQDDDTVDGYLAQGTVNGVILQPGSTRASTANLLEADSGITVPGGKTLTLQTGVTLKVLTGQTLNVAGTLTMDGGALVAAGDIKVSGQTAMKGEFSSGGILDVSGNLSVDGGFSASGTVTLAPGAEIRARHFDHTPAGWDASAAADSEGYYTLERAQPARTYTITFDPGGGTVTPASAQTGTDGKLIEALPTPTREGYDFDGWWFAAADGGTEVTAGTVFNRNATIYAHWTAVALSWRIENGTLYISGTGAMPDYDNGSNQAPWRGDAASIKSVEIDTGITSIGDFAFYGCPSLQGITIPASVTSLGQQSFAACTSLKSVTVPATVTQIGTAAFAGCSSLNSAEIHANVRTLAAVLFMNCSALTRVEIPDSVTVIGAGAFQYCTSLTTGVTLPSGLTTIGGNAFAYSGLSDITIPDGVTTIAGSAFEGCASLQSVSIPVSVTRIDENAFSGCTALTVVQYRGLEKDWRQLKTNGGIADGNECLTRAEIHCKGSYTLTLDANGGTVTPDSTETDADGKLNEALPTPTREGYDFDGWWFAAGGTETKVTAGTVFTGDTTLYAQWKKGTVTWRIVGDTLTIGGSGEMEDYDNAGNKAPWSGKSFTNAVIKTGVTEIGGYAFWTCTGLTGVTIPDRVTSIGECAFMRCSSLTGVTIPDSVTSLGGSAFAACSGLKSVTIPDNVTSIGSHTFEGCTALTGVTIPDRVTGIGDFAFFKTGITTIEIPGSVRSIGQSAFESCKSLTGVTVPDGVTGIGQSTFAYCESLKRVTIPGSVTGIGVNAFKECDGLTDVYYGGTEEQWKAITIDSTGNSNLTGAAIHYMQKAGDNVYWEIKDDTLTISGSGPMYDYNTTGSKPPWSGETFQKAVIEDGVTRIGDDAFYYCGAMKVVSIPKSVTSISRLAFQAAGPTDVYYDGMEEEWNALTGSSRPARNMHFVRKAGENVYCALQSDGVTLRIWGSGAMRNFEHQTTGQMTGMWDYDAPWLGKKYTLTSAVIEEGVTSIGNYAFVGFDKLESVTIPDSVNRIGPYAFTFCKSLKSAEIPSGVTEIPYSAFDDCSSLASVTIPDTVTKIGDYAFDGCYSLERVTIPSGVTAIGSEAFQNCRKLTSVELPAGLTRINQRMFEDCTGLTEVTIPAGVTAISSYAFNGCTKLARVNFGGTRAQWDAIKIDGGNTELTGAEIRCSGPHTITFDPGGGRVDPASAETGADGKLDSLPTPTRSGYTFRGWFTGETEVTVGTVFTGPATVYAHWKDPDMNWWIKDDTLYVEAVGNGYLIKSGTPWGNEPVKKVVIPPGKTTGIGASAFNSCKSITSVTIPYGVTYALDHAFYGCSGLESLELPNGFTSINRFVFADCTGLKSVKLPASVDYIADNAFRNCSSLTDVYYRGTKAQWEAFSTSDGFYPAGNDKLTKATIHCTDGDLPTETGSLSSRLVRTAARYLASSAAPGYVDVPDGAWYAEAAAYCREHGLMIGTGAGRFSPNSGMTRAMMVTALYRLAGRPVPSPEEKEKTFPDVKAGTWYAEAVSWAGRARIVLGYPDGRFGPDNPVSHEQAELILRRYSGDPALRLALAGAPKSPATRAEIAAALADFAKNQTLAPGALSVYSAMNIMCGPSGIAPGRDGSLLVTDVYNKQVWRVLNRDSESYAGGATMEDLYGRPVGGYNDAGLDNSYFKEPWAIAPFLDGWAVSDRGNNAVRLIQGDGVETINGATAEKLTVTKLGVTFDGPTGLASDGEGNLYVSDTFSGAVRKITPKGGVSTAAVGLTEPTGLCWKDGALYIAETGANRVLKLQDGKLGLVAGSGEAALTDGAAEQAAFSGPQGVAVGDDGSVYVADTGNGAIRRVKNGTVTTLAARDMAESEFGLTSPVGLLVQGEKLYICDSFARKVFVLQIG